MGFVVLGLQQAGVWGWTDAKTIGSILVGIVLLVLFVSSELREREPLIRVRLFEDRGFFVDNAVLLLMSAVFVPFFFFASVYAQAALGFSATNAGLFLLVFFGGFATAAQWGGRIFDKRGARPAVVLGCAVSAVGFYLWGRQLPDLDFGGQWYWVVVAGAGLGLVLGPVSTDALNRAPGAGYGEVTGITQTVRNLGASLGLAVMGSLFASDNVDQVGSTLRSNGVPAAEADRIAHSITAGGNTGGGGGLASQAGSGADAILHAVKVDIAQSTQTVVWIMAGIMAAAFIVARLLPKAASQPTAEEPVETIDTSQQVLHEA
jgi:predicted MFS family arabinose efflux permease